MTKAILVISVDFLPTIGGISMMTHHLANALAEHKKVVVLAPRDAQVRDDLPSDYELVIDSESQVRLREGSEYPSEIARIETCLARLHSNCSFDAILLMHPFYYGYAALKFAQRSSVPIGCYFHGFELKSQLLKNPVPAEVKGKRGRAWADLRHSTLVLLQECDAVFVNSSVTAELVIAQGRSDVCITGCGLAQETIDRELIDPFDKPAHVSQARSKFGWAEDLPHVGYFGRITPSKNLEFIVAMLVELENWVFVFAGVASDAAYMRSLQTLAQEKGVSERVKYLGELSEQDKWDFLAGLDLFCLPSRMLAGGQMEGFGIVMLEATIKGTPLIASTNGGMRDFVLDNNGWYLDLKNQRQTIDLMMSLVNSRDQTQVVVRNAQRLLRENLSYRAISKRISGALLAKN